ncbi:MAG TPA: hypothetical protein VK203_27715 [Nostocaceae cyanobacterium]|nr:hypothetical protein [Nostocaceae cyanobacterium]
MTTAQINGTIKNLKCHDGYWSYDIFINEEYHGSFIAIAQNKDEAIEDAKKRGQRIREMLEIERLKVEFDINIPTERLYLNNGMPGILDEGWWSPLDCQLLLCETFEPITIGGTYLMEGKSIFTVTKIRDDGFIEGLDEDGDEDLAKIGMFIKRLS